MLGKMPGCPRIQMNCVDVRDVAEAHVQAVIRETAGGNRFIICAGSFWFSELATMMAADFPDYSIPTYELPSWIIYILWFLSFLSD